VCFVSSFYLHEEIRVLTVLFNSFQSFKIIINSTLFDFLNSLLMTFSIFATVEFEISVLIVKYCLFACACLVGTLVVTVF